MKIKFRAIIISFLIFASYSCSSYKSCIEHSCPDNIYHGPCPFENCPKSKK